MYTFFYYLLTQHHISTHIICRVSETIFKTASGNYLDALLKIAHYHQFVTPLHHWLTLLFVKVVSDNIGYHRQFEADGDELLMRTWPPYI